MDPGFRRDDGCKDGPVFPERWIGSDANGEFISP
jgi:hypothetical protein